MAQKPTKKPQPQVVKTEKDITPAAPLLGDKSKQYLIWGGLAITAFFVFWVRSHFFDIAMERDEGIYAYFGKLIRNGRTPYVDFYETRFPGTFYSYAFIETFFGYSIEGIAMGIAVLVIGTCGFIFLIGRKMYGNTAGITAAFSYGILSAAAEISGFTRQSEHIVSFFTMLSLWLMVKGLIDGNRWWLFLLAGMSVCMGLLIKSNVVYLIVGIGLVLVAFYMTDKKMDWKKMIVNGLLYSAGVFSFFGLMCAYIASKGAFDEMWLWAVDMSVKYVQNITFDQGKEYFAATFSKLKESYGILIWLGILGGLPIWATDKSIFKKLFPIIIGVFAFLTITPGYYFYGHYWIMWMPALALTIGIFFDTVSSLLKKYVSENSGLIVSVSAFCLLALMTVSQHSEYYTTPDFEQILRGTYGTNPFPEAKAMGEFLKKKANPNDKLMLLGSEPELYVYSGMDAPTKHSYFSYLVSDTTKTDAKAWQKEFIADIEREKPRFLVFFDHPISILANQNSDLSIFNVWLNPYLQANYKRIGIADMKGVQTASGPVLRTDYIFDEAKVQTYQKQGQTAGYIFERL